MKNKTVKKIQYPIFYKFPDPVLNNTTTVTLGNTEDPIEVFPPEIFFKDIEPHQNYEVTVTVRNISKMVRRIKFSQPKTNKFKCDYDMQGPVAAGLAIKMNVSFESDQEGDFHDVIEITTEDHKESYKLYLHALKPAPDVQFEPLVNFKFIPIGVTKYEEIEFKNEGRIQGTVNLISDSKKTGELLLDPNKFTLEPEEIKKVRVGLTVTEPDFVMRLIQVQVDGQDRVRNIEITATSVEHHLSVVFEEGGGQKSSLNFGTLYMGERREYPAFIVNNGPKSVNYNFKFKQGLRNMDDEHDIEEDAFISPHQAGKEQTDRVLTAEPSNGQVGPYSQIPIKFVCRTKKYEKIGGFSDHAKRVKPQKADGTAMIRPPTEDKYTIKPEDYQSTAYITFGEGHQDLKVQMMARACYPEIKINRQIFQFGECPTNDRRDYVLTIKNKNEDLPLDFNFTKIAHFHAIPGKGKLLPGTEHCINISFEPKNYGVFNSQMDLEILGGVYKIPLTLMGSSNSSLKDEQKRLNQKINDLQIQIRNIEQSKSEISSDQQEEIWRKRREIEELKDQLSAVQLRKTRGPQAIPDDFVPERNPVTDDQIEQPAVKALRKTAKQSDGEIPLWLQESTVDNLDPKIKIDNTDKIDQYLKNKSNKTKYNEFLKKERQNREREVKIQQKMKSTSRPPPQTLKEIKHDVDLGLDFGLEPPDLQLPTQIDPFWVEKPIGKYEPYHQVSKLRSKLEADENRIIKKKWKPEPTTQAELRDCSEELTGEQLQKIIAGPQKIDFKRVFVKSSTTKSFIVQNDLRQNILVRLIIDQDELKETIPKSQVIPPGQEAGFDIVFQSKEKKSFNFKVTYFVNDCIQYKFQVIAIAEPVVLDLSKQNLKFQFPEDNMEMSISETIMITNSGNATAKYKWVYGASGVFVPSPIEEEVPAGSSKQAKITFTPPGPKPDDEMLTLKIEDGASVDVKCTSILNEARCAFIEKSVEFGNVPVGLKAKEEVVHIKNQIRTPAIFHVQCDSEELTIVPMKGKIMADQKQPFTISFLSKDEKEFNSEITVHIRGGKPLKIPVHANAMIPDVKIEEDIFDFQGVTFGDSKVLNLTLHNDSNIEAKLILDIRDYPEFEIILPQQSVEDDVASEIMVPIQEEINFNNLEDINPEDIKDPLNEDENEEEEEEDDEKNKRYVQITLKPERSPLRLMFKYTPCDVEDPRQFEIPLKLAGVNQDIEGLNRIVKGVGVKPRFLLEPTVVNFKTKVIAKGSKPLPFHSDITISNPDHNPITWSIDRDILDKSKVYQMNPTEGRLEPGTTSTVRVTFNPLEPLEYITKVPLYIDGDKTKPYLMIEFRGEGAEAKIYFDRREVILPPVPLGFQGKATFLVCHNGYENLELRPKIATEVGKLPISLNFPDGKNLGVTKQKLKVEAVFQNKKPLSFTTYIDFYDDEGNKFSIPISGTTDNSIFTIFSYIQRNQDEIVLRVENGKPITLEQDATSDQESGKTGGVLQGGGLGKAFSKAGGASSVISRTARSLVGFNPVPVHILEKNCEYVCRWFNATLLNSTMQNFPNDIINQNGSHMFELIAYLSGKRPPGQAPKGAGGGPSSNAKDNLKVLLTQYEELINFLKVNGAHLNTVRPEYLLSLSDYNKFLRLNPKEENMKPKTLERIFPYLSMESWITVFYQVLKIYYLNRVTPKSFKSLPGMPGNESNTDQLMQGSNVYSLSETILLKWMQFHYNKMNPTHPKQITNFDEDIRDGTVIAALIKSHYGNSKNIKDMKASAFSDELVLYNAKKIIEAIHEIGLQTHLFPADLANPSARELLLFVVQLYQGLPHYIPKASIDFPAVLGDLVTKNIELSNPSKNPICYWVKLDGSLDFSIDEDSVRIEPGQIVNFPIKFQSRISNPVNGKIIFTNKKEGNIQAAAMVFELVSNVYERNSIEKIEKTTRLYKQQGIDLELHNPFPQDVLFNIMIIYERAGAKNQPKKGQQQKTGSAPQGTVQDKGAVAASKKGSAGGQGGDKNAQRPNVPDPFTCKLESIKVRKNQTVNVPIQFLPFELGVHKCYVVFSDENVGELQYTIIGKADLPEESDSFQQEANAEEQFVFKKQMNYKNDKLEQAKNMVLDKATLLKQREQQQLNEGKGGKAMGPDQKYFEIEISNPFFTGPSNITLFDQTKTFQKESHSRGQPQVTPKGQTNKNQPPQQTDSNINVFELNCNPTKPASYTCYVILKSLDKTDIRVYKYVLTAIPQKIKAQLEFRVPARGIVQQEIPIVNNSTKEWTVIANLEQVKGGCFSLQRTQITVKKGTTENFLLSFKPSWIIQVTGMLTLNNKTTGEVYEYELKGFGEEPLAEEHIILTCKARETKTHTFEIKNPSDKPLTYTVQTDLQNAVGKQEFIVKAKDVYKYDLSITPLLGGVYTASITFKDNEDKFYWYTVEVRTDSPKPEASVTLETFIRKAASAEIQLDNPLNEPITFEVFYSGEGLIGDSSFGIEPKSVGTYSLIFSPLQAGSFQGTIGFLNEKVGEFWYDLNLIAQENPPFTLALLECELGKVASHFIILENPTGQELFIDYRNTNPTNYEIIPEKIVLPPYESQKVCIQYSPSNLDVVENAQIIFENPAVGKWDYGVEGKGLLPTIMEPQPISTAVGNNTSSMLTFKNPFREQSTVQVHMETDDQRIFALLLKRNKFNIGPLGILQIPYSFSPQTMTESKATIVISMSKQLIWRYPLRGIAESASTAIDYHFKTRARKPFEETLKINLPGFEDLRLEDSFRYEINVQNPQHRGFIERSVFFEQKNERISFLGEPLEFFMRFEPLRPFKTNAEFIVYKSTGGRWKFNIIFESLDPEVDDIIIIQSPLHKTSSVSFKLCNHMRTFAEFNAFFTPDSAPEFVVYPKTGLLEPYGKEGTNFIVSFTPTEYGKAKVGKLVIQTEEMQWTYEIRGSHPQYKIPEVGGGRIQNKLSKEVATVLKQKHTEKKNFIQQNLKNTTQYAASMKPPGQMQGSPSKAGGQSIGNISQRGVTRSRAGGPTTAGNNLSQERSQFLKP